MVVAGEIALGLVLALFIGALVVAIADRVSELSPLREGRVQFRRLFVGLWAKHVEPTKGQAHAGGGLALDAMGAPCWFEQFHAWRRFGLVRLSPN
jgi:hypothetical protein